MLKKQFLEITAAVDELKAKTPYYSLQLDGWTSPTKEYIFQVISMVGGIPFFETQPTSQGQKCDAAWMLKQVEGRRARPPTPLLKALAPRGCAARARYAARCAERVVLAECQRLVSLTRLRCRARLSDCTPSPALRCVL